MNKIITLLSLIVNVFLIGCHFVYQKKQVIDTYSSQFSTQERLKGPLKPNNNYVINTIKSRYLIPPSSLTYNLNTKETYKYFEKGLTWGVIDSNLKKLFNNEPPGFFVEAGALDGQLLSNTLWLEKEKGWKGLLVEPNAGNYQSLLRKHRKAWVANSCLSTDPYPKADIFISYGPTNEVKDDKSYNWHTRGLTNELELGHKVPNTYSFQQVYSSLQCFPLESFLYALNVTVVDFLSLDIQGGEMKVLKFFPWDKFTIRTMAVEYFDKGERKFSKEFMTFMKKENYTLIDVSGEPDYIYIKNGDKLLQNVGTVIL